MPITAHFKNNVLKTFRLGRRLSKNYPNKLLSSRINVLISTMVWNFFSMCRFFPSLEVIRHVESW